MVLALGKLGNERFVTGQPRKRDFLREQRASAAGQSPAAIVLSCVDSRVPAEIVLDVGIGDIFNARLAGFVVDDDTLGSMEFACHVAGAKLVLVLGHTACGANKGAIDGVELGNLTVLLAKIRPAIDATAFDGERTSKSPAFVDAVARTHVAHSVALIRERSPVLRDLEQSGRIRIVGAMYDLSTGRIDFG
jgi:carbonic anhydrase